MLTWLKRLPLIGLLVIPLIAGIAGWNADAETRSANSFEPIAAVLRHPRCMNCHPRDDTPKNGDAGEPHRMRITRGADDRGAVGARCNACHRDANSATSIVPGAPHWALAPASMGWQGLSTGELCAVLKDPKLNGNRSVAQLVDHMENDALVRWGWDPGRGREPVPIPHDEFVALLTAWAAAGAPCPAG